MVAGPGSGSVLVTYGSGCGSGRPKNIPYGSHGSLTLLSSLLTTYGSGSVRPKNIRIPRIPYTAQHPAYHLRIQIREAQKHTDPLHCSAARLPHSRCPGRERPSRAVDPRTSAGPSSRPGCSRSGPGSALSCPRQDPYTQKI